jgi:hypothetical protein
MAFWDSLLVSFAKVMQSKNNCLTLEDGTNRLSPKDGKQLAA